MSSYFSMVYRIGEIMSDKCIVFGCTNRKGEGKFVGDICAPCFHIITQGDTKHPSTNFIHTLAVEKQEWKKWYFEAESELRRYLYCGKPGKW